MSLSKSVCGFFKGNCLGLQKFLSSTASVPAGFCSQKLGDFSSWHWDPGLGGLVWGQDSSLPRYPSQFLSPHLGVGPACSASVPLLPVMTWFLLEFCSWRPSMSSVSDGSERWLSVVQLQVCCGCGRRQAMLACATISTGLACVLLSLKLS